MLRHLLLLLSTLCLCLVAATACFAAKKPAPKPVHPPTEAEMRAAYDLSVKKILALATNPASIQIVPLEKAWFAIEVITTGPYKGQDVVKMYVVFDGQNAFGATVRSTAICRVNSAAGVAMCS